MSARGGAGVPPAEANSRHGRERPSDFIEAFMLRAAKTASGTPGALLSPGEGTRVAPVGVPSPHEEAVG